MDSNRKERFWTGRVLTRSHARKIIGRLVIALGVIAAFMALSFIGGVDPSKIAQVVIFASLALALKFTKSPVIAAIALALATLSTVFGVVTGFAMAREGIISPAMFVVSLTWLALPVACFRGFVATRALRKIPEESVADTFA